MNSWIASGVACWAKMAVTKLDGTKHTWSPGSPKLYSTRLTGLTVNQLTSQSSWWAWVGILLQSVTFPHSGTTKCNWTYQQLFLAFRITLQYRIGDVSYLQVATVALRQISSKYWTDSLQRNVFGNYACLNNVFLLSSMHKNASNK